MTQETADPLPSLPVFIPYMILFVVISTIYLKWRKNKTTDAEVV
jgi:hypothetical protein